jgi:2-keto-4-pentenoate hydratase/2-oxohepta-3-ene-1,7-dioic acid hydratase in catechol pathway
MLDSEGRLRDLSGICTDIVVSPEALGRLEEVAPDSLPLVQDGHRMGVPWSGISKFICIGLNYSDHAAEAGLAAPSEPIIFLKAPSAICGPDDDTIKPVNSTKLDWEVELGIVIGRRAQHVSREEALDYVAGYCVVNDISERAFQMQSGQWDKGKGCDTFGPLGPWLVTKDEVPSPNDLDLWLDVNGVRRQSGNTRTMIFDVPTLISYCSAYMTLEPGDVIATGTPPGVGMGMKPQPVWLEPGDVVTLGIEGLGQQLQKIVSARKTA